MTPEQKELGEQKRRELGMLRSLGRTITQTLENMAKQVRALEEDKKRRKAERLKKEGR